MEHLTWRCLSPDPMSIQCPYNDRCSEVSSGLNLARLIRPNNVTFVFVMLIEYVVIFATAQVSASATDWRLGWRAWTVRAWCRAEITHNDSHVEPAYLLWSKLLAVLRTCESNQCSVIQELCYQCRLLFWDTWHPHSMCFNMYGSSAKVKV